MFVKRAACFCFAVLCFLRPSWGQTNGIFADFATSKGAFTVYLDYERAPRAVASFVGLATGEKAWADPQGNIWNKPFYNNSIFHRVVKGTNALGVTNGIAIQGGGLPSLSIATNGVVTTNFANAGYVMLEGVTNGLAHSNGVISMANSGPNTDGSQFFIMATNWASWNGGYSVFGHVTTGMNVVTSIAAVAVQGQWERPVEDVALHSVTIRRVGAAATNFNIAAQGVPVVEPGRMSATPAGTNLVLRMEQIPQTKLLFCESASLGSWNFSNWGFYTGVSTVVTGSISQASLGDKYFFHATRTWFPVPITSMSSPRGRYFTFWWNTVPAVKYEVVFNSNWLVQGQYRVTTGTNAPILGLVFIGDSWLQEPYSARLGFQDDSGQVFSYSLGFNPGQATNRFTMSSGVTGIFSIQ